MHIVIYGIGAVGGFYGLQLAHYLETNPQAFKLSFIARGKTLAALKEHGGTLTLKEKQNESFIEKKLEVKNLNVFIAYSQLNIDANELTVVMLCTKSKDTLSAAQDIASKLTANTIVISVQNGVENEERLVAVLGKEHVIGGMTNVGARVLAPGQFFNQGSTSITIGELDGTITERIQATYDLLKKAGINVFISKQIIIDLWSKLVWNASFNPTSVLYEMTTGEMLADPNIRKQIQAIMNEVKQLAFAQNLKIREDIDQKHITSTDTPAWYDFRTSMLQDYQKGNAIELDDLLGVVVKRGKQFNVATPCAEKLYEDLQRKLQTQKIPN